MLKNLLRPKIAYAHCDIPCGIYDPHNAQMGAHTVIRMTDMINELNFETEDQTEIRKSHQQITRLVRVKEKHAALVEKEVVTLWADYFKEEHFKEHPSLTKTVKDTLKLASKTRQEINPAAAQDLLKHTQEIAEIFYKTKGVKIARVKAPYPTEGELIVPTT